MPFTRVLNLAVVSLVSLRLLMLPTLAKQTGGMLADEVSKVLPCVVTIQASNGTTQGNAVRTGSGFIIDNTGLILTNKHVVEDKPNITVILGDGTALDATLVGMAHLTDIALLHVSLPGPVSVVPQFGNSDAVRIGDTVFAIGNPLGLNDTVTVGIVSGLNRNIMESPFDDYIQTDAAINHGNSGGPLFNIRGEVIGMNSVIFAPGTYGGSIGLGFAIPSNVLRFVADQLRQYGHVMPGWIGARIQQPTPQLKESLGLDPSAAGAIVVSVLANGPAGVAGLQPGDVVLGFNGQKVSDTRALARDIAMAPIGRPSTLLVWRNQAQLSLTPVPAFDPRSEMAQSADRTSKPSPTEAPHDLGLQLSDLTQAQRTSYALGQDQSGLMVAAVAAKSIAADAGLVPGDLILRIENCNISATQTVLECLRLRAAAGQRYAAMLLGHGGQIYWIALPISSIK